MKLPNFIIIILLLGGQAVQAQVMDSFSDGLTLGSKLSAGSLVGTLGNTGRSTGPHLHFEVLVQGVPQDPQKFLAAGEKLPRPLANLAPIAPKAQSARPAGSAAR